MLKWLQPSFLNEMKKVHENKQKIEQQNANDPNKCKVFGCPKKKAGRKTVICTVHAYAPRSTNKKNNPHIIIAKLEMEAYFRDVENAKILKKNAGPICKLCQTADINMFSKSAKTLTRYYTYCNVCNNLCRKHSDLKQEKRCYKSQCKYCKRDGNNPTQICHNGECEIIIEYDSRYGKFCSDCYFILHPGQAKIYNNKIKEKHFAKQLQIFNEKQNNFLDTKLETQRHIVATDAEDVCRVIYPDFCYEKNDRILFIEFDENQHKNKRYQNDYYKFERSELIREHAAKKNKVGAILRFNPDSYRSKNNEKIASYFAQDATGNDYLQDEEEFQTRFRYFTAQLQHFMQCDLSDLPKEDVYYFFDGFDTDLLLSSGCKRKLDAI